MYAKLGDTISLYLKSGVAVQARPYYLNSTDKVATGYVTYEGREIRFQDNERKSFWFADTNEFLSLSVRRP